MLSTIYMALLYGLYVPDWEYRIPSEDSALSQTMFSVKCGVRGDTGPACNAVGMLDRTILGIQNLYKKPTYARTKQCSINSPDYGSLPSDAPSWCQAPFDPKGLLSSVMAVVTCLIGLHFGHVIVHFKDHKLRILQWMIPSFCLVILGLLLDVLGLHMNKVLYTFSYTCATVDAAGVVFVGIYVLIEGVHGVYHLFAIFDKKRSCVLCQGNATPQSNCHERPWNMQHASIGINLATLVAVKDIQAKHHVMKLVVEITKGSKVKYELDKKTGLIKVEERDSNAKKCRSTEATETANSKLQLCKNYYEDSWYGS